MRRPRSHATRHISSPSFSTRSSATSSLSAPTMSIIAIPFANGLAQTLRTILSWLTTSIGSYRRKKSRRFTTSISPARFSLFTASMVHTSFIPCTERDAISMNSSRRLSGKLISQSVTASTTTITTERSLTLISTTIAITKLTKATLRLLRRPARRRRRETKRTRSKIHRPKCAIPTAA